MRGTDKIYGKELVLQAEKYLQTLNGSALDSLKTQRESGLKFLQETGFPGPKAEEYKFTRLTRAISSDFDFSKISAPDKPQFLIDDFKAKHEKANVLFFINGEYDKENSIIISGSDEISIQPLSKNTDLSKVVVDNEDPFSAQNDVFANNGVLVEIAKGKSVAAPIICYYMSVPGGSHTGFVKNFYLANENSNADFVHYHASVGQGKTFVNESKTYIVKANADINLYNIQEESEEAIYIGNTFVHQARDSRFSSYVFTFNGHIIRNNLNIKVDGEGCEANMYGLYLTKGNSHVDNHTAVDHIQPNSESNELYKGIIDDNSRGVFNGKIFVRQAAQKTNAFQSNGNILLSDKAVINTKPQLEIWADDVKCSHGCTTGQLDEEAIFYLRARGIDKEKARSLILLASLAEVIEKINLGWLRTEITDKVTQRLEVK